MPDDPLVSYTPRGEDVVLQRVLRDPGAPIRLSVDGADLDWRALLERGWELVPLGDGDVHVLVADPPAARSAASVRAGARPWVCLAPGRAEDELGAQLRAAGYATASYDGAHTYLVHPDHAGDLLRLLDHPAQPEEYRPAAVAELTAERDDWRERALRGWSEATVQQIVAGRAGGAEQLARELDAIRATLSWRVTAPLRVIRRRTARR